MTATEIIALLEGKFGTVITASDMVKADVLVEGEIITLIGKDLNPSGHEVVDCTGKYLMPGGIELVY